MQLMTLVQLHASLAYLKIACQGASFTEALRQTAQEFNFTVDETRRLEIFYGWTNNIEGWTSALLRK